MIDIYDEIGYVKIILEKGLSQKWERDAALLARYYKIEGKKKKEIKQILEEKCERYVIGYNKYTMFSKLNKIIDKTWKNNNPLREIREVKISKKIVEWFLNLENIVLTDEQINILKQKREGISIKKNIMNFNRIKFLFTLYIWTKIQENYLEKPNIHYINNYLKKFKESADLPVSFKFKQERNLLYDLGYIHINYGLGIEVKFIEKFPEIFKLQNNDDKEDYYILSGEDLNNCGYWLTKIKNGSSVCQLCGKEYALKNKKSIHGRKRLYCYECSNLIKNKKNNEVVIKVCINCGKEFTCSSKSKTEKCSKCQEEYRRLYKTIKQKEYREKLKSGHHNPK